MTTGISGIGTAVALLAASLLFAAPKAIAQIDPRSPESRGGIFIPLDVFRGREARNVPDEINPDQDMSALPTADAAAVALARVGSAAEIASGVRALASIDTTVLPEARDMTARLAAHLPRYRRSTVAWLHEGPRKRDRTQLRLAADSLLVLLSVDDNWHQIYDPVAHRVGWIRVPCAD